MMTRLKLAWKVLTARDIVFREVVRAAPGPGVIPPGERSIFDNDEGRHRVLANALKTAVDLDGRGVP